MKIRIEHGPAGTYILKSEDGRDLLIQNDQDLPSIASYFGGRFDFDIERAMEWLDDVVEYETEVEDPGYFDNE